MPAPSQSPAVTPAYWRTRGEQAESALKWKDAWIAWTMAAEAMAARKPAPGSLDARDLANMREKCMDLAPLVWKATHPDFRGVREDGTRCVCVQNPVIGGTESWPLPSRKPSRAKEAAAHE